MSAAIRALGLDQLSVAERILLGEELWDSIAEPQDGGTLSEAHRQDIQRHLDAYRENPKAGSTWDEVRTRLRDTSK